MSRVFSFGFLSVAVLCFIGGTASYEAEDRLYKELFENRHYNRRSRPVVERTQTVNVTIEVIIVSIVEVDDYNEVFRAMIAVLLVYTDERLQWNATDYDGVDEINSNLKTVWHPDLKLFNSVKDTSGEYEEGLRRGFVLVSAGGICMFSSVVVQTLTECEMDITWFPFDEQRCELTFTSWRYYGMVKFIPNIDAVKIESFRDSGEWELLDMPVVSRDSRIDDNLASVTYSLHLRRKPFYYVLNLIFPCALFAAMAILTFVLPPESGERTGLGITVLLTLIVYQMVINEKLPTTSDSIPMIGIYFGFAILMCTVSLVMTLFVLNLQCRSSDNNSTTPLPRWAKHLICHRLARLLCMTVPTSPDTAPSHENSQSDLPNDEKEVSASLAKSVQPTDNEPECRRRDAAKTPELQMLEIIASELRAMRGAYSEEKEDQTRRDELAADWNSAARVLDRLFFIIFTVGMIIGPVVIYLVVKYKPAHESENGD